MSRSWDEKSIAVFNQTRDVQRRANGQPPWNTLTQQEKQTENNNQKSTLKSSEVARLKTQAWPLEKFPIGSRVAPNSGTLLLPRDYRGKSGFDTMKFYRGQNLNRIVYEYYSATLEKAPSATANYVSQDGLSPRRHEFMGPSPHVADLRWSGSQVEIEWWDPYEQSMWIGTGKWSVDIEYDEIVESWVITDRGQS